jgi:hypothetical protein
MMAIAGDIVLFTAHFVETDAPATGRMLGLVIRVDDRTTPHRLYIARGGTQKVCPSGHLDTEVVLHDSADLKPAGLHQPTRFDLADRMWTTTRSVRVIGRYPLKRGRCHLALLHAFKRAGL